LQKYISEESWSLARVSRAWPTVLQRRFVSALAHTPRRDWSYTCPELRE
jgi:hypothetical protein